MKKEKSPKSNSETERDVAAVGCLLFYYVFLALGTSDAYWNDSLYLHVLSIVWWVFLLPLLIWMEVRFILAWITVKTTERERKEAHKRGEVYIDREEKHYQDWKLLHDEAIREQDTAKNSIS